MELPKRKVTAADIVLISVLALLLAVFAVRSLTLSDASYFTVQTPEKTETHSLSTSGSIAVVSNGIRLNIVCENGKVRIENSECPDLTCVSTGAISRPGESIVCVPAELVITIPGAIPNEKDGQDEIYIVG